MQKRKRIVVFSGAGMSAESGLKTFRDSGGLWEEYDIAEVATPEAWSANPEKVLEFYNQRRLQVLKADPNEGHRALRKLEAEFEVAIVTQNIDDLHERAGSTNVLHLHGEILKSKCVSGDPKLYQVSSPLKLGDLSDHKKQLRPHVVWFGEDVPEYDRARQIIESCDILLVIGTSLNVYPAAGLVHFSTSGCQRFLVDPNELELGGIKDINHIKMPAGLGVPMVVHRILKENQIEIQG